MLIVWVGGYSPLDQILLFDTHASPSRATGAMAFAIGTAVPFVVLLVGLPLLGSYGLFDGVPFISPLISLVVAAAMGGAVAGGPIGKGRRGRIALAGAYSLALWPTFVVVATLPALTGQEGVVELGGHFVPVFVMAYLVLGISGSVFAGVDWRLVLTNSVVCGGAGAVGGLLLAVVVAVTSGYSVIAEFGLTILGASVCLVASAIGGWWCRWFRDA